MTVTPLKQITIYTDGACIGNPGPGGYGVVMLYDDHREEMSEGFRETTNNRMELLAVIKALEALSERYRVTVYSDSKYVVDAMSKGWAHRWRSNGWRRNKKEMALNPDLWERLLARSEQHEVEFRWVRGHNGDPGNERCDYLATSAARNGNLLVDHIYESQ